MGKEDKLWQEFDAMTFEIWCAFCGRTHQRRVRPVPCVLSDPMVPHMTSNIHAICDGCQEKDHPSVRKA